MDSKVDFLEKKSESFVSERRKTVIAFAVRSFLNAVNLTIIAPSAWLYMKRFNESAWFYAIALSSYELIGILTLPVAGRIFDLTKRTRETMLIFNTFDIIGDIIYSLPYSPWCLLAGRAISGIGAGFLPIVNGEVGWMYTAKNRRSIYALLSGCRLLGLIIGPILAAALIPVHVKIGSLTIDYTNGPGILAALLWIAMQHLAFFMVTNVSKNYIETLDDNYSLLINEKGEDIDQNKNDPENFAVENASKTIKLSMEKLPANNMSFKLSVLELNRLGTISVIFCGFTILLSYRSITNLGFLVFIEDFHWGVPQISLLVIVMAFEVLLVIMFIKATGRKFGDINFLLASQIFTLLGIITFLIYVLKGNSYTVNVILFISAKMLFGAGYPCFSVPAANTISIITPVGAQGFVQGVDAACKNLACLLAPLIGCLGIYTKQFFGYILIILTVSSYVVFGVGYNDLKTRYQERTTTFQSSLAANGDSDDSR